MTTLPILYSFRRCPYAMRARLAIMISGIETELREVVLRDKPPSMIEFSEKATVPVLVLPDGNVLDESSDIMFWALQENDPQDWLIPWREDGETLMELIRQNDGPFKHHLDRYKYPSRYEEEKVTAEKEREAALEILAGWNDRLRETGWLMGGALSVADMALRPFVRQFAHVDRNWFYNQPLPHLQAWLDDFLAADLFAAIMKKYDQWQEGTEGVPFPAAG